MTGSTRSERGIESTATGPPGVSRRTLLRGAGLAGAGLVGATASTPAAAQEGFDGWLDDVDNYDGTTTDRTGESDVSLEVGAQGNGGPFAFEPPALRVSPGTTVTFEWTSDNHNVVVEDQPDGAEWTGEESLENSGYTYSHTFETEGVYKYFCEPHLSLGMKGAVVVGPAPGAAGDGGDGSIQQPTGPPQGITVWEITAVGLGAAALLSPYAVYYYSRRREVPVDTDESREELGATPESDREEPEHAIGHDEYDPVGTLSLIVVYFLILVGLWLFMYFVEFLGNGPTVIG